MSQNNRKRKTEKENEDAQKMNGNKYLFYLLVAGIFGIMFLLNHYTFYAADDYSYMNSFATHKKIQTVWDIFPSMYAHAKGMNGRLVAHFLFSFFAVAVRDF